MTAAPKVGILDHGSGNLHSVVWALSRLGADAELSSDWDYLMGCDGLVLPGVGAYSACLEGLRAGGHVEHLVRWAGDGRPLLGICVGHQALFEAGDEHGVTTSGLGLLPGRVTRLNAERLPHMGWNQVEAAGASAMFAGVGGERFYFLHSYAAHADPAETGLITWGRHESDRFVAGVEHGSIWGTQFHPEKSGSPGARLLTNWLRCLADRLG